MTNDNNNPFWQTTTLTEMSRDQWESLCDHCGKCCLLKLQDEDASEDKYSVYYTDIVCDLFNKDNGDCADYDNRQTLIPNCVRLTQDNLEELEWMPPSCSYRRIMEGRGLPKWHHLITGNMETVHLQKKSVLGRVVFEHEVDEDDLEEHIITWPLK